MHSAPRAAGSYWNLVMPYALASGLFEPGGRQATGVLRYHAPARLAPARSRPRGRLRPVRRRPRPDVGDRSGLRAQHGALPGRQRPARPARAEPLRPPRGGHGPRHVRLGRSGVGRPAARASRYRAMFLPPNGTSNAAYLETLRLTLVHETTDRARAARRPRARIRHASSVARSPGNGSPCGTCPTSFGPVSYSIDVHARRGPRVDRRPRPGAATDASAATPRACRCAAHHHHARRTALPEPCGRRRDDQPCRPAPDVSSCSSPSAVRAARPAARGGLETTVGDRLASLARSRGYREYPPDGGRLVWQDAD